MLPRHPSKPDKSVFPRRGRSVLLAGLLAALPALSRAQTANITRGPYLQAASPDSIHMIWRTRKDTKPVVHHGPVPGSPGFRSPENAVRVRRLAAEGASTGGAAPLSAAPAETRQYEAVLNGLKPDSTYYHAIYDGDTRRTPEDNFRFDSLADARDLPRHGTHVIALEGHKENLNSADLTLDPFLILRED